MNHPADIITNHPRDPKLWVTPETFQDRVATGSYIVFGKPSWFRFHTDAEEALRTITFPRKTRLVLWALAHKGTESLPEISARYARLVASRAS